MLLPIQNINNIFRHQLTPLLKIPETDPNQEIGASQAEYEKNLTMVINEEGDSLVGQLNVGNS